MRAKVNHESDNIYEKLPIHISQPKFKADPGHRIKSMFKPVFELAKSPKSISTVTMGDAMQYRMYIGCYIKNRPLPLKEFKFKIRAPIEYILGCHEWCDKEWCWSKELEEMKIMISTNIQQLYFKEYDSVS